MSRMRTTTIFAFRDALLEALRQRPALAKVLVSYGLPGPKTGQVREVIYSGDSTIDNALRGVSAPRVARSEEYRQVLNLEVIAAVASQRQADARLLELWDEVADLLAADPKATTDFITSCIIESAETDSGITAASEYYSGVALTLRVRAQLI